MRSLLFTPGDSDRKLEKGLTSEADVILIDLEDAVTPENKVAARDKTAEFLRQDAVRESETPFYVRINDLETEWAEDDLAHVVPAEPAGIMLPKARSHDDVTRLADMLGTLEQSAGLEKGSISILVIAPEIPEAVLNIASFQTCDPRVTGISWGSEDLATGLAAAGSRDSDGAYRAPIELARSLCLAAGSAAGIHVLDTVYADFRDLEGLKRDAERAAADGFSGKMAIHPDQVAVINAAFTPGEDEIAHARRIIEAFEAQPGAGAINMDGAMVDMPHLQNAKKLLERAGLS